MSFVPPLVSRNWELKLSSFGLAVFLWLWAVIGTGPSSTNTMVNVPITVEVSDSGWTAAEPPAPSTVEVHFAGSLAMTRALGRGDARIRIPITAVEARDTVVEINRDWVVTDGLDVVVTQIIPSSVRISLEESMTKTVPISMRTTGQLPAGQALADQLRPNPRVVSVSGPKSRVSKLDSIPAQPLDLGRLVRSGVYEVPLDTAGLGGLTFGSTIASFSASVEDRASRVLPAVRVQLGDSEESLDSTDLTVDPSIIRVTLSGVRTLVDRPAALDVRAEVPSEWLSELAPGEVRKVPLRVVGVPELVTWRVEPDSALVRRAVVGEEEGPPRGGGEGRFGRGGEGARVPRGDRGGS